MSRRKMNNLAEQLKTMYLTENPINYNDRWHGCKYFICFHNTNTIVQGFSNIPDTIEFLNDVLENGVTSGSHTFY